MNDGLMILLVEDDDVAAESVERSLKKGGIDIPILHATNGAIALEMLRDKSLIRRRPLITLLDLNMPRMNGFEFLREVRSDPALSSLVVFVLTTSDAGMDRARAYQEHIAGYMVKSAMGPQFSRLSNLLREYAKSVMLP
jgi:CheY-like chemotaxis protein